MCACGQKRRKERRHYGGDTQALGVVPRNRHLRMVHHHTRIRGLRSRPSVTKQVPLDAKGLANQTNERAHSPNASAGPSNSGPPFRRFDERDIRLHIATRTDGRNKHIQR